MERGIDHLVLCVHDLDSARQMYGRLGFATTPKATHPFGTGNSLIQLQGNFIELLSVVAPEKITPAEPGHLSFGALNAAFLENAEGMSMLAFQSGDADGDQAEFAAHGLDTYPTFDFSRKAALPGGGEATVAFSLAYVTDVRLPGIAFFTCEQHAPEHFWKPEYQRHANGAAAVAEVVMVADDPRALEGLFTALQGPDNVTANSDGLGVETSRGRISVLTPQRLAERFPVAGAAGSPPRFAAYRVAVANVAAAEAALDDGGHPFTKQDGRLLIGPTDGFGMVIELTVADV